MLWWYTRSIAANHDAADHDFLDDFQGFKNSVTSLCCSPLKMRACLLPPRLSMHCEKNLKLDKKQHFKILILPKNQSTKKVSAYFDKVLCPICL